jgi:Tol biopolymer transport system component
MLGSVALLFVLQAVSVPADSGEVRLRNVRQLTFGGQNAEAYFSRSGRQLILQRTDSAGGCDQQYVINVDGTGLRRVSSGRGQTTCGYFYANDARILYATTERVGAACPPPPDYSRGYVWSLHNYDIVVADADGSNTHWLESNSPRYDAEATLSPDGRTLVFTSLRDGDLELYTMNVDGSHVRRLTHTLGYDGGAFFSHDGQWIVYRSFHPATAQDSAEYQALITDNKVRPSRMEIWIMRADGTGQRQITSLGGANFAPYFHPDNKRILFASNHKNPRSRNFDLYLVNVDGTGLEQVTTSGEFDSFPMFSPDGTKLVWASNRHGKVPGETNLFIAEWVERP